MIALECAKLFKHIDAKLYRHQIDKLEKLARMLKDGTETIN